MTIRRLKYRRRNGSSQRNVHPMPGYRYEPIRRSASPRHTNAPVQTPRIHAQIRHRIVDTRTVIRMEGDSIAYFWALETETAIGYEALVKNWRDFSRALLHEPKANRWLSCAAAAQ